MLLTIYSGNAITGDNGESSLNILVYGASGKVGQHIVDEALGRGHTVTAVSRDPSRIVRNHENLVTARGDILDPDSVAGLVDGHDIIVVSVRGVVGDSGDPSETVVFRGVDNVVKALRTIGAGAPRLIHVGGAGSLEIEPGVLLADRLRTLGYRNATRAGMSICIRRDLNRGLTRKLPCSSCRCGSSTSALRR